MRTDNSQQVLSPTAYDDADYDDYDDYDDHDDHDDYDDYDDYDDHDDDSVSVVVVGGVDCGAFGSGGGAVGGDGHG